jgi:hypothetical protein
MTYPKGDNTKMIQQMTEKIKKLIEPYSEEKEILFRERKRLKTNKLAIPFKRSQNFRFNTESVLGNIFFFSKVSKENKPEDPVLMMVEVQLTDDLQERMDNTNINLILHNACKTLLNSVPMYQEKNTE